MVEGMAHTSKKQSKKRVKSPNKNARDATPIRIGNRFWDVIRSLAWQSHKSQRVIIEEHLKFSFLAQKVPGADSLPVAGGAPESQTQSTQLDAPVAA
jgi:hypothetical protein